MGSSRLVVATAFAALLLQAASAGAHNSSRGKARFAVGEDGVVAVRIELNESDLLDLVDIDLSTPKEAEEARAGLMLGRLSTRLPRWLKLVGDGQACPLAVTGWDEPAVRVVQIEGQARCARQPEKLTIHWGVSKATNLDLVAVALVTAPGGIEHPVVFSKGRPKAELVVRRPSTLSVFGDFLVSGGEHILTGWDHLAFLLALILGCATLRRLLLIATGFTVAHSVTLALGALDVVRISPAVVEPIIAASIAVAAAFGVWRLSKDRLSYPGSDKEQRGAGVELVLVGSFGLVHGLGFASMLTDALAGAGHIAVPLVAFNVGVELGQVACVAVAFPLLRLVGRTRAAKPVVGLLLLGLVVLGVAVALARVFGG